MCKTHLAARTSLVHWGCRASVERRIEVPARSNFEFGEDLAQMPFHRARAQEQLRTDLEVGEALPCQLRYLLFLRCEFVRARLGPAADLFSRCQ